MSDRRLELEAVLRCGPCDATVYRLFRRQVLTASGEAGVAFENVLWPADPHVTPPRDPARIVCPTCGEALKRVAA